jgi:hypothetical protein
MNPRHAAALARVGWYLMIPPVFSPMGSALCVVKGLQSLQMRPCHAVEMRNVQTAGRILR